MRWLPLIALAFGLAACADSQRVADRSVTAGLDPEPLLLSAQARVSGDAIVGTFAVTNQTEDPIRIGYGACAASLLGWRDAARTGPPAFDAARAAPLDELGVRGCILVLYTRTLEPGAPLSHRDAAELEVRAPVADVLADSLPDGRYWLTAVLGVSNESELGSPHWEGPLRADLGPIELAAARPALDTVALRYGVRFAVDSVRVAGGRIRAVVRMTGRPFANAADIAGWAPCGVAVLAYTDPARRDAAPRRGSPDAAAEAACGQTVVPFERPPPAGGEPAPDEPAPDEPPLYVALNAPQRLVVDLALADLLGRRPSGRYALAVAVRPLAAGYGLRPMPPVHLILGDADWAGR